MHSLIHINSQEMSVLHNLGNKYIFSGQGGYGLDHYLILSWDGTTEWAAWSQSSCHVDNRKALYYIRYFAYDPTTTTTSTTSTSSTTSTTTTKQQQKVIKVEEMEVEDPFILLILWQLIC